MTTLPGFENDIPPATDFIKELLEGAVVAHEVCTLPPVAARNACETRADIAALYAPYFRDLHHFLWYSSLAHTLRLVHEASPNLAAGISARVRDALDSGDFYPEMVWEWATEHGLDPQKITEAAAAAKAKLDQEPAPALPTARVRAEETAP